MKEYFLAKNLDIGKLPIIFKTATGIHERVVFKGGILAQLMRGSHHGKRCVWFPEEAKYVNKILEAQIFASTATKNLILENNNCNVNIFEIFGDVSVFWTVPIIDKIINQLSHGLQTQYKSSQFVGHSIIINLKNIGVLDSNLHIESQDHNSVIFKGNMTNILKQIETCLNIDFMKKLLAVLKSEHRLEFIGYEGQKLYFLNDSREVIILSYWLDGRLNNLCKKLSFTSEKLIDDCESTRFQN